MEGTPEALYLASLTQKDRAGVFLQPWVDDVSISGAAAVLTLDGTVVPNDMALMLTAIGLRFDPGAASIPQYWRLEALAPTSFGVLGAVRFGGGTFETAYTAALDAGAQWAGNITLMPGWRVRCIAAFSAAPAQTIYMGCMGMLVPAGRFLRRS